MDLALVPIATTNATSVRIFGATLFSSVPTYREVDTDQAWFWTPQWQAEEREADEDIQHGRVKRFTSAKDLLDSL
jgi:hypothetical protein